MPKRNMNLDDPFVPVTVVPLYTQDGSQSSRNAVMLDLHGGRQEVGIVSDSYQLVPNHVVHDIALDVLDRADMPFEDSGHIFDGKRYRQRWVLPDLTLEPRPGDIVNVALDLINSYDGSTTFGLMFNARRLVCSNGMQVDFMLGGFRFKHFGNDRFAEELQEAARRIQRIAPHLDPLQNRLRQLTRQPVERGDIQTAFRELKLPLSTQAEVFDAIEEDTGWGLLNGFTDVLTRQNTHRSETVNRQVMKYMLAA
jgi:hypothetical protein